MMTALHEGFSGTLPELIVAVGGAMHRGSVKAYTEPTIGLMDKPFVRVEITAGPEESDQQIAALVFHSKLNHAWQSTHRGGLTVYSIPVQVWLDPQEDQWIEPQTGPVCPRCPCPMP